MVIFGATGDLAKRKLLPALYNLNADHLLPEGFGVVGRGREPLTTDAYRERVRRDLQQFGTKSNRTCPMRMARVETDVSAGTVRRS